MIWISPTGYVVGTYVQNRVTEEVRPAWQTVSVSLGKELRMAEDNLDVAGDAHRRSLTVNPRAYLFRSRAGYVIWHGPQRVAGRSTVAIEILEVVLRAYLKMCVSSDGIHPHVTFDVMLESDVRLSSGCRRYRSYAFSWHGHVLYGTNMLPNHICCILSHIFQKLLELL